MVVDSASNVDRIAAVLRDLDVPSGSDRTTASVPLRFAPADELAGRLRQALSSETPKGGALRVVPETRTNSLLLDGSPSDVARARSLAARLDVSMPGASQLHVYRLRYAQAESLVRVISQLLGLPPPPPPPAKERGSSIMRSSMRDEANQAPVGYDGGMGEPPPAPAPPPQPQPVSTGTGAAIPLEAPVRITADPATNTLVVSATSADWETLRGVIGDLDVRRRQVFVEAIILEATTDKLRSLGIELQGAASLGGSTVGFGQVNLSALGTAVSNPTSLPGLIFAAASNQTVTLPSGQQVPAYTVLLSALETQTRHRRAVRSQHGHHRQRGGRDRRRPQRALRRQPRDQLVQPVEPLHHHRTPRRRHHAAAHAPHHGGRLRAPDALRGGVGHRR